MRPLVWPWLAPVVLLAGVGRAEAAPPWVDRPITLPHYGLAIDAGLGIAHTPTAPDLNGVGLNLEAAYGVTSDFEIGLRTGARFGTDGRALRADQYGRLFDTETFGTGNSTFANPELHLRGRLVNLRVLELGLEGRAYLPFEMGTRFGVMFGVPVALHFARELRLDTGLYVPVLFTNPAETTFSIPARLWFQPTRHFWLGPMLALRFHDTPLLPGLGYDDTALLAGFGLGYAFGRFADFKADIVFPDVTHTYAGGQSFGVGVGVGLHFD